MKFVIDRSAFQKFLEAMEPNDEAGLARSCCDCPLAIFLKKEYPGWSIEVTSSFIGRYRDSDPILSYEKLDPPAWARSFIEAVDLDSIDKGRPRRSCVFADDALQFLKKAS